MNITLIRKHKKAAYTIGRLYIDGEYICNTLEPTDRGLVQQLPESIIEKVKKKYDAGTTAIPEGRYGIEMRVSRKFRGKRRAYLGGVPGFSGVMIHEGNTPEDTAGCILTGWNTVKGRVEESRKALGIVNEKILKALDREEAVTIEITSNGR